MLKKTSEDLIDITKLDLDHNQLSGPILTELDNLGSLHTLYLHLTVFGLETNVG